MEPDNKPSLKVVSLTEFGKTDFCKEFIDLNAREVLGPMTKLLLDRMGDGNGIHEAETCLPEDMEGEVLLDCKKHVDYLWCFDYNGKASTREHYEGMVAERVDLSWKDVAEKWLVDSVACYLSKSSQRMCIVLDTCHFEEIMYDYQDINDYYKGGTNEGFLLFDADQVTTRFAACLYRQLGMSFGCLVTLPEDISLADIMKMEEPLASEITEMLAKHTDAVYIGAYDGIGYILAWLNPQND